MGGVLDKGCCSDDPTGKHVEAVNVMPDQDELNKDWKADEKRKEDEEDPFNKAKAEQQETQTKSTEEDRAASTADGGVAAATTLAEDSPAICEFVITLKKNEASEALGIGLRRANSVDVLVIKKPSGRALEVWHSENPGKKVRDGDQIIAVNGISGAAKDMVDEMKKSVELNITIRRQIRLVVTLIKQGALGLKVDPGTLLVAKITDGMIKTWNNSQQPKIEVIEGDKLVGIQGKRKEGDAQIVVNATENLLDELGRFAANDELTLTFTRPEVEA